MMFEEWRRNQLEKKFPRLKLVWSQSFVEITALWEEKPGEKHEYLTTFKIHSTFISLSQLHSLLKIIEKVFSTFWNRQDPNLLLVFELNTSTSESAEFVKALVATNLASELKLLLAISGACSIEYLGLETTLALLSAKNEQYSAESFQTSLYSSEDLFNRALIIFPGVSYTVDSRLPVTIHEVNNFFASEHALQLASFLAYDKNSDLSFGKFKKMPNEIRFSKNERQFCTADLLTALDIVENSPMEKVDQLTAAQLLSLAEEMLPGQAALYPMDVILSRPRIPRGYSFRGGTPCLAVLMEFMTLEELEALDYEVRDTGLFSKLCKFSLFEKHGHAFPMGPHTTTAPILSVLAEIAVTKGVYRYSEVVEVIEGIFPSCHRNWETLTPEVRANLVDLAIQVLNDDHNEIILRWVLAMTGHLPFDIGLECRYYKGQVRMGR